MTWMLCIYKNLYYIYKFKFETLQRAVARLGPVGSHRRLRLERRGRNDACPRPNALDAALGVGTCCGRRNGAVAAFVGDVGGDAHGMRCDTIFIILNIIVKRGCAAV